MLGFKMENNLQVYKDEDGNIIFEEWSTDDDFDETRNLLGKVVVSRDRWDMIVNSGQF